MLSSIDLEDKLSQEQVFLGEVGVVSALGTVSLKCMLAILAEVLNGQ